jgi:hypothetical protein
MYAPLYFAPPTRLTRGWSYYLFRLYIIYPKKPGSKHFSPHFCSIPAFSRLFPSFYAFSGLFPPFYALNSK